MSTRALFTTLTLYFLLLIVFMRQTSGKVVKEQSEWIDDSCCKGCPILSHIGNWPFNGSIYAPICQYLGDSVYYATLFDKTHRIPVFSQFVVDIKDSKRPKSLFDVEPQLVLPTLDKNMASYGDAKRQAKGKIPDSDIEEAVQKYQAIPDDYNKSGYDQGHVNPSKGHGTDSATKATFTLTNVVPQPPSFNRGCWKNIETATRVYIRKNCSGHSNHRVVVGAIPGSGLVKGRVNVPSYMWSYINCSREIVGFLVPNTDKASIHADCSLSIFHFLPHQLNSFLNGISDVYTALPEDRGSKVQALLAKPLFDPFVDNTLPKSLGCEFDNLRKCICLKIKVSLMSCPNTLIKQFWLG